MSGRTRHLREGQLITNRKTDRRNPRVSPQERLHQVLDGKPRKEGAPEIRLAFLLPQSLQDWVSKGEHGPELVVLAKGFVRITATSSERAFIVARKFFAAIAKDRPAFTVHGVIIDAAKPERSHGRHLTVLRGALIVSAGLVLPTIFEELP